LLIIDNDDEGDDIHVITLSDMMNHGHTRCRCHILQRLTTFFTQKNKLLSAFSRVKQNDIRYHADISIITLMYIITDFH